jgi:hypothetical protein
MDSDSDGGSGDTERGESMKREKIKIRFNFRVGLIFNSGGFISIWVGLILNGYAISFPSYKKIHLN